ncbi:MAG: hypothetical protein HS122_03285 [Opitutaceae bacterium]|nr:hypothetical protein [Opitutaceae bacterium]
MSSQGTEVRLIRYRDPVGATVYEFVTTAFHLPADIIAWLYKSAMEHREGLRSAQKQVRRVQGLGNQRYGEIHPSEVPLPGSQLAELFEVHLENDYRIRSEAGLQRREKARQHTAVARKKGTPSQPC